MTVSAPVCHIPPKGPPNTQPTAPQFPDIPNATDLQSALQAISAMRDILRNLTRTAVINNYSNNAFTKGQPSRWVEDRRVTEVVRVYNPTDRSQYVDVERINNLIMKDTKTGLTWNWARGRS